ncbi:MAG: protein-methionine-sulfoxide reductase heme-binding subunit MsrQ [Chloroflexota bacterium]
MAETAVKPARRWPFNKKQNQKILLWLTHIGSLLPLVRLYWRFRNNALGADPIREILFFTGITALVLLVLTVAVTPLITLFGWSQLAPLRKWFGLYSFLYVNLHFVDWLWLDYGFNWQFISQGILNQRFVLVGFAAWLLMVPLAMTSNRRSQKWLKRNWRKLHQLTYVIIILALLHFFWLVKNVYIEPTIYAVIVVILLALRIPSVRKYVATQRRKLVKRFR